MWKILRVIVLSIRNDLVKYFEQTGTKKLDIITEQEEPYKIAEQERR